MKIDSEWVKDFILRILTVKGYSRNTLDSYLHALDLFAGYLEQNSIDDMRRVSKKTIKDFLCYLNEYTYAQAGVTRKLAGGTKQGIFSRLRNTFAQLVKENHIFSDPFQNLHQPAAAEVLPRNIMSTDEINRIFDTADTHTYMGFRNRTMFEVLYGTGVRISELMQLNISDIDFGEKIIFIRNGKGSKDRLIPCTRTAFGYLKEYLDQVRPVLSFFNPGEKALFLSVKGSRLTKVGFYHVLNKALKKAGIMKQISPHTFRHTFAVHLLQGGANIRYIQEILGHEQLSTTQIYTRVSVRELKEKLRQYHPRNNELYEAGEIQLPVIEKLGRNYPKKELQRL